MINLARGGVALTLVVLLVSVFYFQRKVEAVSVVAIDSQNEIQKLQQDIQQLQEQQVQQQQIQDKENNSSNKTENKETITVTIDNLDDNNATSTSKKVTAKAFTATAYCLQGRTATGGSVRRGIVAADPRVLPLGTKININAGSYSGSYLVADTGGAVKGKKLDIWVPSCSEARRFGRKSVKVNVLGRK
ncbi:MAG: 3D domain-containing protein [Pyrinomonadaceae bacterium]